jgi:hypothetical protein
MIETPERGRRSAMGRKRHGAEQIIAKLREAEVELARSKTAGEVCRKLGVTEQTYYLAAGAGGREPSALCGRTWLYSCRHHSVRTCASARV